MFERIKENNSSVTYAKVSTKLFHNQWPTMEREYKWNRNSSELCPLCEQDTETKDHIFQCRSSTTTDARDITMGTICGFFRCNSHPLIARQIERILNQFHRNYNIPLNPIQRTDSELEQKIQGMDVFLNGLIPSSLIDCRHEYFKSQSSKPSDIHIWTQSLIELLHPHAINLW